VWISNRTFKLAVEPQAELDEIVMRHQLTGEHPPDIKAIAHKLDSYLENRHLGVRNFKFALLDKQDNGFGGVIGLAIGVVLSLAAVFSLVVGGVNVMNAEFMKLAERTREYGIRRTLGATSRELGRGLVFETMAFCLVGGIAGVILGAGGAWLLSKVLTAVLAPWPFSIALWSVLTALGASAIVGLFAGIAPARRARRLVVVECLRQAD
jgi:putative ABC transport system permease protein